MINLSQNSRAYSIPYSCRMIIFCFITTIKLFTLLLYHLHVSLGLQLIKKEDRGSKCKKKHYNRAFYWGKQKHSVQKPCWDQFIPISTYTKLIIPLCEAKVQEVELYSMIWFKKTLNMKSYYVSAYPLRQDFYHSTTGINWKSKSRVNRFHWNSGFQTTPSWPAYLLKELCGLVRLRSNVNVI